MEGFGLGLHRTSIRHWARSLSTQSEARSQRSARGLDTRWSLIAPVRKGQLGGAIRILETTGLTGRSARLGALEEWLSGRPAYGDVGTARDLAMCKLAVAMLAIRAPGLSR